MSTQAMRAGRVDGSSGELLPQATWRGRVFSSGWRELETSTDVVEPATLQVVGRIGLASPGDIGRAVGLAREAQSAWADLPYEERAAIFRRASQLMQEHTAEISSWIMRESGGTRGKAAFEVGLALKALHEASAMPSQPQGIVLPSQPDCVSIARRRPIGVVGVIAPFNFPLYLALRAVAPALAVGNAVVLKPDPRTAVCGGVVIARIFQEAGLPEGVLHMLPGAADAGAALCAHPQVGMIQFTGSSTAGRKVGELAGRNLKKVSLELGGKNSLIVLDDADLDLAVSNAAWGAYLHQGQICMASSRILVHRKLEKEFVAKLAEKAAGLPTGDPSTDENVVIGPLINQGQRDHIVSIVRDSIDAGARLETGGTYQKLFFRPTVLSQVKPGMRAFEEEIFGPVAPVTAFDDDREAVALANQTEYGLSGAILSSSVGRATALGRQLRTGLLHINNQTIDDEVINPFGGVGVSGNGTSIGGPANWDEFTQWQWMTIRDKAPARPI
ncbi:benzaldehyde dehydrogenase [Pendulispora albinea]|uniref:Benzaldehyde dehydrogenase n=1 Tax=Pendulispora albinea TaxID=2741071 RepID=A0ABZ2M3R6_9BACT